MQRLFCRLFLCLFLGTACLQLHATHNRAGEITYEQIGELTIRVTVTTYTKTSSAAADRDSVEVFWGDGNSEFVPRANGEGDPLPNDIKINYYIAEHTYPGRGTFTISMMDPNRVAGILNVNFPNSVNVPFYIETTLTLLNPQFQGFNNSAILLQEPIDFGCVGRRFVHNPNAYDIDGDSLSYELIVPFQDMGTSVPDYSFPNEINPGDNNQISLNSVTGNFVWDAPQAPGEYNIAIRINEYREGVLINSLIRDMQILVEECQNEPPVISTIDELCVIAGEKIEFDVEVNDADNGQMVSLSASGGPFILDTLPAELEVDSGFHVPPLNGKFIWQTSCDHISDQFYQVVFRAVDNSIQDTTGLADLKTVRIKVVGPPPEDIAAEADGREITVSWALPYDCEETKDDYFIGFSVWRRIGSNQFPIDTCAPGLDGQGYTKIVFLTNDNDGNRYFIIDEDVEKGRTYCYRVLAEFARTTSSGNPFNRVQSLTSDEVCLQISRDLPLITKVSVEQTDLNDGQMHVEWTKPLASDLDTTENPGPYEYRLWRSEGFGNMAFEAVPGAVFIAQNFNDPIDTFFVDRGLNTATHAYNYEVAFHVRGEDDEYGRSAAASSIFLNVLSTDETNILEWAEIVPWENFEYHVYKLNRITDQFDSIATVIEPTYRDANLTNGVEYCYTIKGIGSYGIPEVVNPLLNYSQETCGIPLDSVPPCPPTLAVTNVCDEANVSIPAEDFVNELEWSRPNLVCFETDDVAGYNVYFTAQEGGTLTFAFSVDGESSNNAEHKPEIGISGCYAVTAYDSLNNESVFSNIVCVDNCPIYELPNVFTPNDDGANDLFVPINARFIERVDMQIFNRWGELVYETQDPMINWNGSNKSGKELAEGVYYYSCQVFEQRVAGIAQSPDRLSGYIHVIR